MEKTDLPHKIQTKKCELPSTIFVAPNATVVGNVSVGNQSSIWYGAVLRGDINHIVIGERTNIQDGCILHLENDIPCVVGDDVTIGHGAIIHACTIEEGVLVGMGAIILNGAVIKKGAVIGAGAVVKEHTIVPAGTLWAGVPAKQIKKYEINPYEKNVAWAQKYVELANIHHENITNE
ncbi:gamma carbonic anhydrase family protein [Candidatus Marinamargulisbacteria bacterium SCGC AG-414-C22]|nr:gamma carbonic anhydrase family protein [Candidatus Marinamargulisbacteria bacterium SCGC AG-414-C22]